MSIENKIAEEFNIIGRHKYNQLKSYDFDNMNNEEVGRFHSIHKMSIASAKEEIEKFESKHGAPDNKKVVEYFKSLTDTDQEKPKNFITKEWLFKRFDYFYQKNNGVKYSRKQEYLENLKPLIYYFIGDWDNFLKCSRVIKSVEPSPEKGLLIIGGYGNGKTSTMTALSDALRVTDVNFSVKIAKEVSRDYEFCKTPDDKKYFYENLTKGTIFFDDLFKEKIASNFGKVNVIEEVLELRYRNNKRTYANINYKEESGQSIEDIDKALSQFGEMYNGYTYDRIFKMFNVVEFKGKSLR